MEKAVEIRGLTKRFGSLTAVDALDLDVARGEVLGFLGLNGAGKTTTIRILLDLLRPTSGTARVFGRDCQKEGLAVRASVGHLPGELGLYSDMTGRQVLDLLGALGGKPVDLHFRGELQERLALPEKDVRRRLREYSTGMKRKLGLIQAFQTDPPLLILDEPTEGLDPVMQESLYALLADMRKRGATVFMSSHVLSEVDRVCDRIALLRRGELVLHDAVDGIRKLASRRVTVRFAEGNAPPLRMPEGVHILDAQPRSWSLRVEGLLGPLLELLRPFAIADLEVAEPKLEDVILKYYREGAE
jgi:ABC-2 type transport system ATP-binding protein